MLTGFTDRKTQKIYAGHLAEMGVSVKKGNGEPHQRSPQFHPRQESEPAIAFIFNANSSLLIQNSSF